MVDNNDEISDSVAAGSMHADLADRSTYETGLLTSTW
jgi:hypothetical protein